MTRRPLLLTLATAGGACAQKFLAGIPNVGVRAYPVGERRGRPDALRHPGFRLVPRHVHHGRKQNTPNADDNPLGGQPQSGIWFGETDDLWSFGKPKGWGGP